MSEYLAGFYKDQKMNLRRMYKVNCTVS